MNLQTSKEITAQYLRALVLGPPGVGKTFACATISEHFKNGGELKDLLWFLFDDGGLDGFAEYGISVPVFDFTKLSGPQLTKGIREAVKEAKDRVANGVTKTIVADSLTVFDKALLSHLMTLHEKWGLYNALLKEHSLFFHNIKKLPCHVLFTCHEKYLNPTDDDAQTKKAQADGLRMGSKTMDITGQGARFYRANCSLILPMKETRASSGVERVFLPRSNTTESKSRFACLGEREPADFSLLLAKIQKAASTGGQTKEI
jgi:hypothetical protein